MNNISATRYSTFEQCPLKYNFKYNYNLLEFENDSVLIGGLYHKLLDCYHSSKNNEELLDEINKNKNKDIILGLYKKYLESPIENETVETEREFVTYIDGVKIPLYGFIDRVCVDTIVEYKTTSKDYTYADADTIQALIYIYSVWRDTGKLLPITYSINNKKKINSSKYKPQIIVVEKREEDLLIFENTIKTFINNIFKSNFEPTPGQHCYWCPWGNKGDGTCIFSK